MSVHVTAQSIGGESYDCFLHATAHVRDLKAMLSRCLGFKPSRFQIVTLAKRWCGDDVGMLELTECPLADLLDPAALRNVQLDATLHASVCNNLCCLCGGGSGHKCAGCGIARYCSRACQRNDWQRHKKACKAMMPTLGDARCR